MRVVVTSLKTQMKMIPFIFLSLFILSFLMACQTPSQYRLEADEAAKSIIEEKQDQALGQSHAFSIERPADILRRRLLIEHELPYTGNASLGADKLKPAPYWPEKEYPKSDQAASDDVVLESGKPFNLSLIQALQIGAMNSAEYQTKKEDIFKYALSLDLKRNDFGLTLAGEAESSYTYDQSDSSGTGMGSFGGTGSTSTSGDQNAVESIEHDGTLSVGNDIHQRHQMQTGFPPGHLGAQHNEPHLGAVAVGDHHLVALFDEIGHVVDGFADGLVLILDRLVSLILDK